MSVTAAAGHPQYADMGLIPTLFAKEFNVEYWATTIMPRITTGKFYEGLLKQGHGIEVATLPSIDTFPYKKGMTLPVQAPESTPITMDVNRARGFNILIDDIDLKQTHLDISGKYVNQGVDQMREDVEKEFFESIYSQAHADNQGTTAGAKSSAYNLGVAGTPIAITTANATEMLTRIRAVLGEQNCATPGKMWVILPEWMRYYLVNSDLKNAALMGDDTSVMRTGRLGSIDGLTIYVSNLLYTTDADETTGTYAMGGNMDAISHIQQLNKVERLTSESTFGKKMRGLNVYDWNVRKPEGLVSLYCYKG